MDYLESSILSIAPQSAAVLIGVGSSSSVDPTLLERLQRLPECAGKIEVRRGAWLDQADCFNELARLLWSKRIPYALLMDPDEVYADKGLHQILDFVACHPEAGQFQSRFQSYWRSPAYQVDPLPPESTVILTRITPNTQFEPSRKTNELPLLALSEETGVCHSFTFANCFEAVRERLFCMGLSGSAIQKWKQTVWDSWKHNRALRNLHPVRPDAFRGVRRISTYSLPEALSHHPFLRHELVNEEPKQRPACSVIFQARSECSQVQKFVQNLIETVPSDCELIGCTDDANTDIIKFLRSKPDLKVVVHSENREGWRIWAEGSQAAEGKLLVFLRDCLSLEGDWVEGFHGALEGKQKAVVLPRVLVDELPPGMASRTEAGDRSGSISVRSHTFELRRGRYYGIETPVIEGVNLEELICWACSTETWNQLLRKEDKENLQPLGSRKGFYGLECFVIEDTPVFIARHQTALAPEYSTVPQVQKGEGKQEDSPTVSIVIPVFNNLHFTQACLQSIFAHTPSGSYEVIVVDNSSTDGTGIYLKRLQPRIRCIRNRHNLFFAKGCNRGAWAAKGEYVLFLNNDTVVKPGWLQGLLDAITKDPRIGIVGNKQLFPSSNPTHADLIWHAGVVITAEKDPWHIYYGLDSDHPLVNKEHDYPVVTGCCLLIRKKLFEELQGFDTQFQNGFEDVDLCLRAGESGNRIVYTPESEIVHHVSSSESRFDREITNFQRFKKKWADRLVPNEVQCHLEAGLIPAVQQRPPIRVGYISPFNQKGALAACAGQLLAEYPPESYVVLSEFGLHDRIEPKDPSFALRSWDRNGTWYYPLFRWAMALDLDVLHLNFDFSLFPTRILDLLRELHQRGKKLVVTINETCLMAPLLQQICQVTDAVIVHTPESRLELILNGCDVSKIQVIQPGLPVLSPMPLRMVREKKGLSPTQKIIVTPGFIRPQKGLVEAIAALAELRKHVDLTYLVLGSLHPNQPNGLEYLEQCNALISKYQLERHVFIFDEFLGEDQLHEYLGCADAIVLPYTSSQRSWSSATATALSVGRPVITSAASVFSPFKDAVFRSGGGISLAQAIYSVLTNAALENQLIERARAFADTNTWKKSADAHWEIYRRVVGKSRLAASQLQTRPALVHSMGSTEENCADARTSTLGKESSASLLWSGDFFGRGSAGDSARSMALGLSSELVPLRIEDSSIEVPVLGGRTLFHLSHLQHSPLKGSIVHVDQRPPHLWRRSAEAHWNAVRYLFSGERLSEETEKRLRAVDEVWVSSQFHYESCLNSGVEESKLLLLPETLDLPLLQSNLLPLPIDGLKGFNFLSVFPWHPSAGWDLLLQAFLGEFKQNEDLTLVLKVDPPPSATPKILLEQIGHFISTRLRQNAAKIKNVLVLTRDLTPKEILQLFRSCQAFVLPNRAEDSGRSVMTAMGLGLPVIATAWSGNRDFMSPGNSYPLDYKLVEIPARFRVGPGSLIGTRWAESSVEQIRESMRQVYTHCQQAQEKAKKAQQEILEICNWQRVANLVRGHLHEVSEKLRKPAAKIATSGSRLHICWEGPQLVNHSLALVNREMELALIGSNELDLTVLPVGQDDFHSSLDCKFQEITSHYGKQSTKPASVHVRHQWPPNWVPPQNGHWVVIQPWEYGCLPVEWVEKINEGVDEVWVPTNYVHRIYVESGIDPARIQVIPNGVDTEFFKPGLGPYSILSNKSFKFLFVGGTIHRKGVDVLLQVYQETFKAQDDVVLVIKDMGTQGLYEGQGLGDKIREVQRDPDTPSIVYMDMDLTDSEMAQLYNACDCLVHPYRGEGFGLPVLEAMACGLPVIVTAGGATDDFVDGNMGYLIPARKQTFGNRIIGDLRTVGDLWYLEPDPEQLSIALRHVSSHREEAKTMGVRARSKAEQWTWQQASKKILQRVKALSKEPIRRFQQQLDCVVLVELTAKLEEGYLNSLRTMIQSLQRNSYARLKIVLWGKGTLPDLEALATESTELKTMREIDLPSVLRQIRHQFRAPFLAVVSEPLIFSKQWLGQISDAARLIGSAPKMIAPSINLEAADHYVPYEGGEDEFSFQKFARRLWRSHRGQYQEVSTLPFGCGVVSWDCLSLEVNGPLQAGSEWLAALQKSGVKAYWAKDTLVAGLNALSCSQFARSVCEIGSVEITEEIAQP
jgi:glycosyltransferase involved in cell wall biosynthesis